MLINEIKNDIDWRMSELASLKSIPLRYNLLPHHKEILIKYAVPAIYSLWEGFVKKSFEAYIFELNSLSLNITDINMNLLTHTLSSEDKLNLENPRISFLKKKEFVEFYQKISIGILNVPNKIPTKSNIDYNVINEILIRFNLNTLPKKYESRLKKLLRYRNHIAHGEISIPTKVENLTEFTILINELMVEIFNRIEDGHLQKTYLK